jgi:hypothetical protein
LRKKPQQPRRLPSPATTERARGLSEAAQPAKPHYFHFRINNRQGRRR